MESKKIKIQIKNRFLGNVIFEHESENNTLSNTVREALKQKISLSDANLCDANLCDANLCDANLCGADLCGADFTGIVLDYNDASAGYGDTSNLQKKITENSNLRPTVLYENHDTFASRWGCFWRNLIIVRKWKVVEKKETKIELSEDQKLLIKTFAKLHNVSVLEYRSYDDDGYSQFAVDRGIEDDMMLDFPNIIDGLVDERKYTLSELGIE